MNTETNHEMSTSRMALKTRALDAVDRAHAKAAASLHDARARLRESAERGIERVETLCGRARDGIAKLDARSADLVNRAQGVVGRGLERVRGGSAAIAA